METVTSIFISYRRDDAAGHAGHLRDNLSAHFGPQQVFMDVHRIDPGEDFVEAIGNAVGSCSVLLVVIGKSWLNSTDGGKRRLDDPHDFVRLEVAAALERNIRVVPVLVGGASMPKESELPPELAGLSRRQAQELGDGYRWQNDVDRLISALPAKTATAPPKPVAGFNRKRTAVIAALSLGLVGVVIGGWFIKQRPVQPQSNTNTSEAAPSAETAEVALSADDENRIAALKKENKPIGIDLSFYMGTVDWAKVKGWGISFAYIKAAEGTGFTDANFQVNWKKSKEASISRGAYTVFRADQPAGPQADAFFETVADAKEGLGELPPVVVVKDFPFAPVTRTSGDDLRIFLQTINQRFARKPVIYTSVEFWKAYSKFGSFAEYPLWICQPTGSQPTTLPTGWSTWTFWQFTQAGAVDGISVPVDLNTFNGPDLTSTTNGLVPHPNEKVMLGSSRGREMLKPNPMSPARHAARMAGRSR